VIRARGIRFSIAGQTLVAGVDLDIAPGEILALTGANGAGKSTLLKLLAGEIRPQQGSVNLDGADLAGFKNSELARRRAVLPQGIAIPPLTVAETVALGRLPHRDKGTSVVANSLDEAGLTAWSNRLVSTLSGGEAQRVHLARIRAQLDGTPYCFLDEPTSALDVSHQIDLMQRLRRWAAEGLGIIVALHDLSLAARFADKIAVLHHGKIAAFGSPAAVLTPQLMERAFSVRAAVVPHPILGHPLILPLEPHHA
jgi:iron complex transport system ATP-binding protein